MEPGSGTRDRDGRVTEPGTSFAVGADAELWPTTSPAGVATITAPALPRRPVPVPTVDPTAGTLGDQAPVPVTLEPLTEEPLPAELVADLDAPDLVLTEGYVGPDRRRRGAGRRLLRSTFPARRALLTLEMLVVAVVVGVVLAAAHAVGLLGSSRSASARPQTSVAGGGRSASLLTPLLTDPFPRRGQPGSGSAAATPSPTAGPPPTTTAPAPSAAVPAPPSNPPAASPAPEAAPAVTVAPAPDPTPQQLGAEALALVRYQWQRIPGYSIQFEPGADAPAPGFYGNTTFTWGQAGGTSVLYVYPGETVDQLAGIVAFEIGHEVDAAAVEPQGGHAQIEDVLGIHPASWAPSCDCAEQGYLSGWYAAAFSNYWSPGVGDWSQVAPEPTGATLAAVEPWLDPTIP